MKLGLAKQAIQTLEELLRINSSNNNYYMQILEANGIENLGKES
jgi:hypothetical protein